MKSVKYRNSKSKTALREKLKKILKIKQKYKKIKKKL